MLEKKPRPRIRPTRAAEPFFTGARDGQLLLPCCAVCGQVAHPGVSHCPNCLSDDFTWRAASGLGTIYSFVVMNRSLHSQFPGGYAVCVVELNEGPRFVAEVVGVAPDDLEVGMPVRAELVGSDAERPPLRFVPASERGSSDAASPA